MEYPKNNINSFFIQRTNKNRIYSCFPIIDKSPKTKHIVGKHLYPKYYTTLYVRMPIQLIRHVLLFYNHYIIKKTSYLLK